MPAKSVREQSMVTAQIRKAIADGDFAPNQRLVEADLCAQYDASRSTVRAALQELSAHGLIERIQNRGSRVRSVSLDEAVEITEVRMVVEGLCAAKAAKNITDAEIEELTALRFELMSTAAAGDVLEYSRLNHLLHSRIQDISAQRSAKEILDRLRGRPVRHQFKLSLHPGRMAVSLPEHVEIIDEVCARDPGRAETAMRRHLTRVADALREVAATTDT
ncbi:GntR family transcriptional regulator [Rhodococcus sp. IEGM 248]|nr:GntR family transcriptional regulator [Rhodococcus sp. IEGM 248]